MTSRLAIFDFDRTLSCCHVYAALCGGVGGLPVPPPYAQTERGQLARLAELDTRPEYHAQGGFALAAFGGHERVAQLKALLDDVHAAGVECVICSRGFVGPLRRCLEQVGLLGYFTHVFGTIGVASNPTEYDLCLPLGAPGADARFLGTTANTGWGSKASLIARCLRERGLHYGNAIFIDDTPSEIADVQSICATIQVQPPRGMGSREFELLRRWLVAGNGGKAAPMYRPFSSGLSLVAPTISRDTLSNTTDSIRVLSMESTASDLLNSSQQFHRHRSAPPGPVCPLGSAPPSLLPPGPLLQQLPEFPRFPAFSPNNQTQHGGLYFPFFKIDKGARKNETGATSLQNNDPRILVGETNKGDIEKQEPDTDDNECVSILESRQTKQAQRWQHEPKQQVGPLQPGVVGMATESKNTTSWPTEQSDDFSDNASGEKAVPVCCQLLTGKAQCNPGLSCSVL